MSVYQMEGMKFSIADGDGPYEIQDGVTLMFPEEAEEALNKFLPKYNIDIELGYYFMDLKVKIWACICFTEEHDIAGHVVQSRRSMSQVALKPYTRESETPDKDFIPKVGSLYISSKFACEDLSHKSDLFMEIWNQLKNCDRRVRWLLIMDKLPKSIKQLSQDENKKLWYSVRKS